MLNYHKSPIPGRKLLLRDQNGLHLIVLAVNAAYNPAIHLPLSENCRKKYEIRILAQRIRI